MSLDWLVDATARVAYPLDKDVVQLGRDPKSDVVLPDATVSRRHASLTRASAGWMLSVSGSTGAAVNDVRVDAPVAIAPGDTVQVGTRTFAFVRGELPPGVMPVLSRLEIPDDDPRLLRTTASLPAVGRAALEPTRQPPTKPLLSRMALVVLVSVALLVFVVGAIAGYFSD